MDITNLAKVEKDLLSVQENLDATVKKRTAELYAEIQNHQFAQQTISLQQSHLRNALDNIESAAIIMVDKDLMITAISKQFSTLYNLPAEYCKEGQSIEPILRARALRGDYGKGDVEKLLKERVRKWKRNQPHDYLDFSPDGHVFQVYPKKTSDGGLIAVSMDISKHLRVEEKLNLQKNHLRNALDNVPGAVFMVDKDLKITASSLHMADLYDLPSSICKEGEPLIPLLRIRAERGDYGKGDAATLLKKRIDKWRHNPSGFYEDKVPSGKIYGVQSTRMEDGGMVIAVTDITERKAIEKKINAHQKELETLNTQKDNFFAIIAHDLKSPFNALLGFSEVLSKDITKLSPEKIQDYSGYVHQAAQQSYNLLEDLLHWSRLQLDRVEINLAPLDVNEVIDASLSRLRYIADAKGIKTSVEKTEGLMVIADANMLDTILRNLLSNAIKFTQHSGKIEVSSRKVKKHVHIEVKDNGIGMSKQEIGGLFNFDKNSSKPGTDGETGTGLGLHLCKELLGKQKGKISIKSTEGAGSSFTIILPLS